MKHVSATSIFARFVGGGRQALAYSMKVDFEDELAMVLPLPVTPGSGEDAVEFVNLEAYPDFFADLASGFPALMAAQSSRSKSSRPRLTVHRVGDFEASYVPTVADFDRLDTRFRLPDDVWEALPAYADYGFAVFKLSRLERRGLFRRFRASGGVRTIHPMAFTFPNRTPDRLFFPTVHVHDGVVSSEARFDHALYCQMEAGHAPGNFCDVGKLGWVTSKKPTGSFVKAELAGGFLDGDDVCFRAWVFGTQPNADVTVVGRLRQDRSLLETIVSALDPTRAADLLSLLDAAQYPGWCDELNMKFAFVKLWHDGERPLVDWLAEPQREWNRLRSRALRPKAFVADYSKLEPAEREAIDRADAAGVEAWLESFTR